MFQEGVYYRFGKKTLTLALSRSFSFLIFAVLAFMVLFFARGKVALLSIAHQGTFLTLFDSILKNITFYGMIALGIIFVILVFSAWLDYQSREFMLDQYALRIRSGIFSRHEITIPYGEIQNVNMNETFSGRMMGVVELLVLTAGHEDKGEESSGIFQMIDRNVATNLQDELLRRASASNFHFGSGAPASSIPSHVE